MPGDLLGDIYVGTYAFSFFLITCHPESGSGNAGD